jgi:hypothetical protein
MKSASNYQKEALEILNKINDLRMNPVKYSLSLENFRSCYKGKNFSLEKNSYLPTQEGISALEELINFTEKQKPKNKLSLEIGLNITLKDFCESVKSSEELNDSYNTFESDKVGAKYGTFGPGRTQVYMVNLISEDLDKNILFLLLCDGDDSRQIRDLLLDGKFTKIGVYVKKYEKDDTPMLTLLLADEYKTKAQYAENTDKDTVEELVSATAKVDIGKKPEKMNVKVQEDDDSDLDLPEGVMKIERKTKNVKENGKEYVVTKTVTYMEDGSVNTEIKKEKMN